MTADRPPVPLVRLDGAIIPVVDALHDAVIVADVDNVICYANAATESLLGWRRDDLVGCPVTTIVPERFRQMHLAGFARYRRTRQPHIIGRAIRIPALHADGTELPIDLVLSVLPRADGNEYLVGTLRDVRDRIDLERHSALAHHLLGVLAEGTEGDPVGRVLEAVGESLEWDFAALWSPVHLGRPLECAELWHRPSEALARFAAVSRATRLVGGRGLPGHVTMSRQPAWIGDLIEKNDLPRRDAALEAGLRCAFAFPVTAGGRVVAVIELFRRQPGDPGESMLGAMAAIGDRLGEFLARVEAERERAAAIERERAVAAALQRSLLPGRLPDIPGMAIAARFRPGGELVVGGDWYDVFPGGEGRWTLAVGDVCGHGPEAAALTARVRYTARALTATNESPAQLLRHINAVLLGDDDMDRFCTAIVGSLVPCDSGGARLTVASGGHPNPLIVRSSGHVERINAPGTLLGVLDDVTFTEAVVHLAPGDAVVLFTDGVPEARGDADWLGDERVVQVLHGVAGRNADTIADRMLDAALEFSGGDPGDDIAILVLRAR